MAQIPVTIDPFDRSWLNTRREGNVGCVAVFPAGLKVGLKPDTLFISANDGDKIVLTGENPSYQAKSYSFSELTWKFHTTSYFLKQLQKL